MSKRIPNPSAINELYGWGVNFGQFKTRKVLLKSPKRLGITNIHQVACGPDFIAIIDLARDLYLFSTTLQTRVLSNAI
jgi:alpha-tubulin suppressor-like RCC1 family protein